jgi:hypothetical protein
MTQLAFHTERLERILEHQSKDRTVRGITLRLAFHWRFVFFSGDEDAGGSSALA